MQIQKKFQGLSCDRYAREPLEELFAREWQIQNRTIASKNDTLSSLWAKSSEKRDPPKRSRDDHIKAATLIQWLGSSVGQAFLKNVIDTATYEDIHLPMMEK